MISLKTYYGVHKQLRIKRYFTISKVLFHLDQKNHTKAPNNLPHADKVRMNADKVRMKQNRKEAKRQERITNQQLKLIKKQSKSQEEKEGDVSTGGGHFLSQSYDPKHVESKWYDHWLKMGLFTVHSQVYKENEECLRDGRFSMCLPPPNITGCLHIGHALGCSIQDALSRWQRMNGKLVTWVPGCDHAGIATQVVVEKHLLKTKNVRRLDIGRDAFIQEVHKWKEIYGNRIFDQMKMMGCSLDWSRMSFTLDERLSHAVNEAFVQLFKKGLIYRSRRLVNWSCALKSAISDIEVESLQIEEPTFIKVPNYDEKVLFGTLTTFAYPIVDSKEEICVSTTRLETMLADVALAVHPSDGRYQHLIGRFVRHPISQQQLPIISDEKVDPKFGTGAVKLTPAHDVFDFEIADRHNLPVFNMLDDGGLLVNVQPQFLNIPRYRARSLVEERLRELGLVRGVEKHSMSLPICSRSGDVVEYVVKEQWFVKCDTMAESAIKAVESGELEFVPAHYKKQWFDWLHNIRDWCISRQLWWGHQIPAYKIIKKNEPTNENVEWVAAHSQSEARKMLIDSGMKEGSFDLQRDDDVLDTWFSSSLLPFSNFGWPHETLDFSRLFPTDLLETASDIMFFWVARMVMMSQQLTGKLPFKKVLFHSIVQDARGRKMSKSLGNVIDPMHVINGVSLDKLISSLSESNLSEDEIRKASAILKRDFPLGIPECGADALRFALLSNNYLGHYMNIDVNHFKSCRTFCNKIWHSFKYFINKFNHHKDVLLHSDLNNISTQLSTLDSWILSRLRNVVEVCQESFQNMQLFDAAKLLQQFWWLDFCNIYLECAKPILGGSKESPTNVNVVMSVMFTCFDTFLKLLHPFMPFLSEHLYQELSNVVKSSSDKFCVNFQMNFQESVSICSYPKPNHCYRRDLSIEKEMGEVLIAVNKLNSVKTLLNIEKLHDIPILISEVVGRRSHEYVPVIKCLSSSSDVLFQNLQSKDVAQCIHVCRMADVQDVYIRVQDRIDVCQLLQRLSGAIEKCNSEKDNLLKSEAFINSAHDQHLMILEKVAGLTTTITRIENMIASLRNLKN